MNHTVSVIKLSVTLLRVLTSGIFIVAGINGHLVNPQKAAARIGQASTLGPLFKNVALFGSLLFFIINNELKIQK